MNKPMVGFTCATAVVSLSIVAAQSGNTGTQPQSQTSMQQEMTLNGCVTRGTGAGAQNATFTLNNAQAATTAAPSATVGGSTSTGAGGSAGTTAPSGTTGTEVTSTATSGRTDSTTPRSADPVSGAAAAAGASAPVNASGGTGGTRIPSYTLVAEANQNLANFVGQRVEVRGRMMGAAAATTADVPSSAESSTATSSASGDRTAMSRFQVTSIRTISGTCQ